MTAAFTIFKRGATGTQHGDRVGERVESEHENSKFLLEENIICDDLNCKIKLYGDCIEIVDETKHDSAKE